MQYKVRLYKDQKYEVLELTRNANYDSDLSWGDEGYVEEFEEEREFIQADKS